MFIKNCSSQDIEEAITKFNKVIPKAAWCATTTDLKLDIWIYGKSRTKLRRNENSEEDGR
jgi:hypothetical protein